MSGYGGGGYLPDDCSDCDYCGQPMFGCGMCPDCDAELKNIYPKFGLDANGKDASGRNRSGLAHGYLKLHGYTAGSQLMYPEAVTT